MQIKFREFETLQGQDMEALDVRRRFAMASRRSALVTEAYISPFFAASSALDAGPKGRHDERRRTQILDRYLRRRGYRIGK